MDRSDGIEERLERVPLFQGLTKKDLKLISQLTTYLEEPAGTVLIEEGKSGYEFIIVLDGEVEVTQGGQLIASRGAGDFFGEIALLDHRPRTATVRAKTPVAIQVINRGEFAGLLADVPEIASKIMTTMAERLADLERSAGD
jgi:CRP/FNR family transcriptional regulator, cyclic AMP receptor protein